MRKLKIPLNLLIFLALKFSFTYGQGMCPPNEIPSFCEDSCNRCETDVVCPAVCIPGCQCLPGYTRDVDNTCIPRQLCSGLGGELPYYSPYRIPNEPLPEENPNGRLLSSTSGCPNAQLCTLTCIRRRFKSGICLGPGREYCNCYSNLSGGNRNPPAPDTSKNTRCSNLGQCVTSCQQRQYASGYCAGGDCKCVGLPSGGIGPRYRYGPPPPPAALNPPIPPRLPLLPKPLYPPGLPIPPKIPVVPKPPYVPGLPIPPKLPVTPNPTPPVDPTPPVVTPPPPPPPPPPHDLPKEDCPIIAKCIIKCQSKGSSAGFCTGFQRSTCKCF